jgi:peptide/nickel transport system substrate-binding protein
MQRREFLTGTAAAIGAAAPVSFIRPALAQSRKDTLLTVSESGPSTLDPMGINANSGTTEAAWNAYDRLVSFDLTTDANGNHRYDPKKVVPELAESWDLSDMSMTLKLRRDASFHDGSPVTSHDVKWSFDRAVSIGGAASFTLKVASVEKPEQFVVVDDHTFRIDFLRQDRLTLPVLCLPVPSIINSGLAKKHASASDPWAVDWLKNNEAGGGPYKIEKWAPGEAMTYRRFEDWKSGAKPAIERVIWRSVPSDGNRRALLERGDADVSFGLPPKDVSEIAEQNRLAVVGTPVDDCVCYIDMNVKIPPFDNPKVRQAIAYATPYQKIMDAAMFGRGVPMYGGTGTVTTPDWPQPTPYRTDITKAKQLLSEAGFANGFETSLAFSLDVAITQEPICLLVQESLAQLGIRVTLNKVPGANFRTTLAKKTLPMVINVFGAFLAFPEYFFYWNYGGQNSVFNTMNYQNPEMDKLIQASRFEADVQKYREQVEGFIAIAFRDIPRILLFQPFVDVAMQKNVEGYCFWFHRQLDYRQLVKT